MLNDLLDNLRKLPSEVEWVDFKLNYISPQDVGEYISALSNSACLAEKQSAYLFLSHRRQKRRHQPGPQEIL